MERLSCGRAKLSRCSFSVIPKYFCANAKAPIGMISGGVGKALATNTGGAIASLWESTGQMKERSPKLVNLVGESRNSYPSSSEFVVACLETKHIFSAENIITKPAITI
jgi:hypothetical protein